MLGYVIMATEKNINEGQRIKALLDEKGLTVQDLARHGNVSWQAAKKWIQSAELGPGARETATAALGKAGIDSRLIWPSDVTASSNVTRLDDLKRLLQGFSVEQLESVRSLLEADRGDQIRLIDFIEGIAFAKREA